MEIQERGFINLLEITAKKRWNGNFLWPHGLHSTNPITVFPRFQPCVTLIVTVDIPNIWLLSLPDAMAALLCV